MTYDSIVIGGGSAGVAYATQAGKLGAKVLLIEKAAIGGTCVNRGCVPKKLMWQLAKTMLDATHYRQAGITSHAPHISLQMLRDRTQARINCAIQQTSLQA